jgi:hypothetical protein
MNGGVWNWSHDQQKDDTIVKCTITFIHIDAFLKNELGIISEYVGGVCISKSRQNEWIQYVKRFNTHPLRQRHKRREESNLRSSHATAISGSCRRNSTVALWQIYRRHVADHGTFCIRKIGASDRENMVYCEHMEAFGIYGGNTRTFSKIFWLAILPISIPNWAHWWLSMTGSALKEK